MGPVYKCNPFLLRLLCPSKRIVFYKGKNSNWGPTISSTVFLPCVSLSSLLHKHNCPLTPPLSHCWNGDSLHASFSKISDKRHFWGFSHAILLFVKKCSKRWLKTLLWVNTRIWAPLLRRSLELQGNMVLFFPIWLSMEFIHTAKIFPVSWKNYLEEACSGDGKHKVPPIR